MLTKEHSKYTETTLFKSQKTRAKDNQMTKKEATNSSSPKGNIKKNLPKHTCQSSNNQNHFLHTARHGPIYWAGYVSFHQWWWHATNQGSQKHNHNVLSDGHIQLALDTCETSTSQHRVLPPLYSTHCTGSKDQIQHLGSCFPFYQYKCRLYMYCLFSTQILV